MKIKNNFNKAAKIYNQNAILQKQVAHNLVDFCLPFIKDSSKIIDLGSGTGFLHDIISQKQQIPNFYSLDLALNMLKESKCSFKINSDINLLPLQKNSFDLTISSLALQWIDNFDSVFKQIHNILKPKGCFLFSIIGKNSLPNIQKLNIKNLNINNFPDQKLLEDHLRIFSSFNIVTKKITLKYNNYYDLLQSMKKIGAGSPLNNNSHINISDLRKLMAIKDIYEDWNIIYVIAKK
ncbi:methyltransferase domain-containing protein [Rickettsiales bacterium]|nr:methyltransferase domain-containing protein [Rickettsiales bacterium]MDB2550576.1 methyltransferase domain-containing protein [Rickettsiales bacterium]